VAGRVADYATFSISGLEETKKAKNIFQNIFGVQFEIRKRNPLEYKEAINVNKPERRGAQ